MVNAVIFEDVHSFAELKKIADGLDDQTTGEPNAICEIGTPYIEFLHKGLARPGDEAIIERVVVGAMVRALNVYLGDKHGTIYWRERLEMDVGPYGVVLRYDNNGPDIDEVTNRRCVKDKNWVRIGIYCRLVRAQYKALGLDVQHRVA
jgi:hypothetical protein